MRQRKPLPLYVGKAQAGTGVTLAYERMARQTALLKKSASFCAMADVRQPAATENTGSVATEHPYVVKQSRFPYKLSVDLQAAARYAVGCLGRHLL